LEASSSFNVRPNVTLIARLAPDNKTVLHYLCVPWSDKGLSQITLGLDNIDAIDAQRFTDLGFLKDLALREIPLIAEGTMRLTLKTINDELRRLGLDVHIEKGDGYFYVWKGDANNWLDRTINVPKVSSLTLEQWIGEFNRLKKLNDEMLAGKVPVKKAADPKPTGKKSRKA